jgi:HPt (histidine-containing phosphotransfer) domain-containing protein
MDYDASELINVDDGAKRVGGNMALYKKLLARFSEGDYIETLAAALDGGDAGAAAAAAHTIKGVAANLSLVRVNVISAALEAALKNGQPHDELLARLKTAVADTAEQIASL